MKIGELEGFGLDLSVGIGDLGADAAKGGLEGRNGRSDGGKRELSMLEGGELGKEMVMAGEDFGAELVFEETDAMLELFGGGGGRTGGEGGGGEAGGVEFRREKERESRVGGESIKRRGRL